jgi:hypothetical protein
MSPEPMAPYALAGLVIRDFCKELWGLACDQLAEVGGAAQSPVPLREGEDLLQCLADRGELALHVGLKKGIVGRLELLRLPCRSWCSVIPLSKRRAAASRQSNRRQPRDTQDERGKFPHVHQRQSHPSSRRVRHHERKLLSRRRHRRRSMSTPEDTNQAPDDGAAARGWRAHWKKWAGGVVTAAVVIPLLTWGPRQAETGSATN